MLKADGADFRANLPNVVFRQKLRKRMAEYFLRKIDPNCCKSEKTDHKGMSTKKAE